MKSILIGIAMSLFLVGCSNTWDGVKEDSSTIWKDTKETIHEATE